MESISKLKILKLFKEMMLKTSTSTILNICGNNKHIKDMRDQIYKQMETLELKFEIYGIDTRTENQIWKDIWKKHFRHIKSSNDFNNKISALQRRGYLVVQFDTLNSHKIGDYETVFNKLTYVFKPQIRKNPITYYDNTITLMGNSYVYEQKWPLSEEEWKLYPKVYECFSLSNDMEESTFRSLFQRARYKIEVENYLNSLDSNMMIDIELPNYDVRIQILNSDIPNKDLNDLFGFISEELDMVDLRGEVVYLNGKLFHV